MTQGNDESAKRAGPTIPERRTTEIFDRIKETHMAKENITEPTSCPCTPNSKCNFHKRFTTMKFIAVEDTQALIRKDLLLD